MVSLDLLPASASYAEPRKGPNPGSVYLEARGHPPGPGSRLANGYPLFVICYMVYIHRPQMDAGRPLERPEEASGLACGVPANQTFHHRLPSPYKHSAAIIFSSSSLMAPVDSRTFFLPRYTWKVGSILPPDSA